MPARSAKAERNATNGETSRTASSGSSVNSSEMTNPAPMPQATAGHAMKKVTSKGSTSRSSRGSASWMATPKAAPSTAPTSPSAIPCRRETEKLARAVAPRHRRTATVGIFWRM